MAPEKNETPASTREGTARPRLPKTRQAVRTADRKDSGATGTGTGTSAGEVPGHIGKRIAQLRLAEKGLEQQLEYVDAKLPSVEAGWIAAESAAYPLIAYIRKLRSAVLALDSSPAGRAVARQVEFLGEAVRLVSAAEMARELCVTRHQNALYQLCESLKAEQYGVTMRVQQAIAPGFSAERDAAPPELP
jgi:hypothetical protein